LTPQKSAARENEVAIPAASSVAVRSITKPKVMGHGARDGRRLNLVELGGDLLVSWLSNPFGPPDQRPALGARASNCCAYAA
jgi:hypothetical protein